MNNYYTAGKIASKGAAGGALWGLGYGVAKPILSGEEINPMEVAQEITANAAGGAVAGVGVHYGGALLSRVKNKYMSPIHTV